jgi:Spy/CpxP family protein refolding chaperone
MTPTAILVLATLIMQGTTQPARPPLLAGPRVTPEVAVGGEPVFRVLPGRRPAQFGPYRWQRLLRQVELDSRQRSEIERIVGAYSRAMKAFRNTHGKRVKTLARRERESRDGGDEPLSADERDELRELRAKRPRTAESLRRIWTLLDHVQRQQMRDLLTEARKDAPRTSG